MNAMSLQYLLAVVLAEPFDLSFLFGAVVVGIYGKSVQREEVVELDGSGQCSFRVHVVGFAKVIDIGQVHVVFLRRYGSRAVSA